MCLNISNCGTLIHQERIGQNSTGKLDVGIVILDGIGLFFFLIPGVIAYAVDFINGTIYLPNGSASLVDIDDLNKDNMIAIHVGKENLTPEKIKEIVSKNTGKHINTKDAQTYAIDSNGKKIKLS